MADTSRKTNLAFGVENNTKGPLNEIKQDINAVGEAAVKAAQKGSTGLDGLGTSVDKNSEKVKVLGDQTSKTGEQIDRTSKNIISSMQREMAAMESGGKSTAAYYENIAKQRGADLAAMKPYLDQMRLMEMQSKQSLGTMQMSAAQTANAMRMVPAQFTDIIVSLQSGQAPITVLLQQGGQLKDMFGGVGNATKALGSYILGLVNPYTLAAAAAVALFGVYYQGSQESKAFNTALITTGNAAGVSRGQLQEYAQQIASNNGTVSSASAALTAMVQAHAAQGAALVQYAEAAMVWEKATGQSVEEVAKNFAALDDDPLKATLKLNEGLNYLTLSTYEQIKSLEEQGRKTEAAQVAQDAYAKALKERSSEMKSDLGYIERAWQALSGTAKTAWDMMMGAGRSASLKDKLGGLQDDIAAMEKQLAEGKGFSQSGGGAAFGVRPGQLTTKDIELLKERIALRRQEVKALQDQEAAAQKAAQADAARGEQVKARAKWDEEGIKFLSKNAQMERELAKVRGEATAAGVSGAELEKRLADIRGKYAEKGKDGTKAYNAELEKQRSLIAELGGLSTTFYKDWERLNTMYAKGRLSLEGLQEQQAKLLAQQPFMKARAKEEADNQQALQKFIDERIKADARLLEQRKKSADTVEEALRKAKDEEEAHRMAAQLGITHAEALARLALARAEDTYQKAASLGADKDTLDALQREIAARQGLIDVMSQRGVREGNEKAAKELIKDWDKVSETVGRTLSDYIMGGGKDAAQYLKRLFSTLVLNPMVNALVGSVFGGGGGVGGGGGGIGGAASNAQSMYSLYGAGAQLFYGGTAGASGASMLYANGVGFLGGDSLGALYAANGGWAGVGTGSGAAAGGGGGAAGAGWGAAAAMAIPFIAAYLGGMFKEEKMVGQGLTGELGGNLYGYQLMRESGGLFDGPDYRYVVAEKELADAKARIAELQSGAPYAELGDQGAAMRERELQRLYNQMDVLERNYSEAIRGSQGPIKMLQDAFTDMRENTAKQADSLGLDGDSVRAMKVALGLDEIHPDTGGKGLQLTGLTQEEAAAKIQEALNQANEELARSVLGTWQEQTREITRVIWDQVELPTDGDTQQYGRVAREVTESITEQVWVMSEYVREGETAVQALGRLSGSLVGVNQVFDLLGVTLIDASLAGADWASSLVDAIGGMDALTAATSTYFDLYYSEQEKRDRVSGAANKGMEEKGLDLRVEDKDAKAQYRALMDKAISDRDETMIAWLLQFADDFAVGVDAVTAAAQQKAQELVQLREQTLSNMGLSMDGLVGGFITEVNEGRGAQAGGWLANQIAMGFEQAVYEQAVNTILSSIIDGMITPMLTAAMTGSSMADAVSAAAIDNMIANANAALEALNVLLTSTEFQEGMEKIKVTVTKLGNSIGGGMRPMQNYQSSITNTGNAASSAGGKLDAAADALARIAQERESLEIKLLQLQGNTAELRRRELAALDPSNHALQQQIWLLEDAKAAQQSYNNALKDVEAAQKAVDGIREQGTKNYLDSVSDYEAAQERVAEITRQAAIEVRNAGETLLSWVRGTALNADVGAVQQSLMSGREYERLLSLAAGGDQDALAQLTGAADSYLQAAGSINSGFDFAKIRGEVLRQIGALGADLAGTVIPGGDEPTEMEAALKALQAAEEAMNTARDVALAIGAPLEAQTQSLIDEYAKAVNELSSANATLAQQAALLNSINAGVWAQSGGTPPVSPINVVQSGGVPVAPVPVVMQSDPALRADLAVTNARLGEALSELRSIKATGTGQALDQQRATRAVEDMNRNGVQVYTDQREPLLVKEVTP